MPNAYRADTVLIDLAAASVLRVLHSGPISRTDIESRIRVSRHLQTPAFEVLDGGRMIREEFVRGRDFAALSPTERLQAFKALLASYINLCAQEGRGSTSRLFDAAVEASRQVTLPQALSPFFSPQNMAISDVRVWPLVPSHGDMSAENIIVRDGCPVLVDWEEVGYFPFCYDPLWLMIREATTGGRSDLLHAFLNGRVDTELEGLWRAAGLQLPDRKVTLLAPVTLLRAYQAATSAGLTDPDRLCRYLWKWFPRVQPVPELASE